MAIPLRRASFGELNFVSTPSTRSSPSGHFTGTDSQVDSGKGDDVAVGLPDILQFDQRGLPAVRRGFGGGFGCSGHGSPFCCVVAEAGVGDDGEQQHRSEEELEPVRIPAGVDDALVGHTEDERTDHGADGGAVATGEQAATGG